MKRKTTIRSMGSLLRFWKKSGGRLSKENRRYRPNQKPMGIIPILISIAVVLAAGCSATESRSLDAVGHFLTGHSSAGKGDYRGALEDFAKAVEIDPLYAQAYWDRAAVRAQLGDWRGALTDVNKALEIKPDVVPSSRAYEFRGLVRRMLGEHKESIEDSNKAIEIDPRNARAYVNRGISRMILGDLDEARLDLDKALQYETDPRRRISIYNVLNKIANLRR
ncbi:MAG: tetratricopeptide repeat protein [Deltaproteobacteria bacterium]|nr:tetratricopeptide repeat protein [Deltaproteobacteria bacterium]